MCKIGDILLIYNARNKRPVGAHPFIVLDDSNGVVSGIYSYDFIGLLITSANKGHDNRFSYAEADKFFYFDKSKIKYIHLGKLDPDVYNLIIEFIEELSGKGITIKQILDKTSKIEIKE